MGPFLCVERRSECPSDVPYWCSHKILEMGVALSPFVCDGTMAPLGRPSEPGPHRRCWQGLAPGEEGGGSPGVHTKATWRWGGGLCWRTKYQREDGWGLYTER